jgi:hypothetical protein
MDTNAIMEVLRRTVLKFRSFKKILVNREGMGDPVRDTAPYTPVFRWDGTEDAWEYLFTKSSTPLETIHLLCAYHKIPNPPDVEVEAFLKTFQIPPPVKKNLLLVSSTPASAPGRPPAGSQSLSDLAKYDAPKAPPISKSASFKSIPLPDLDTSPWQPEDNDFLFANFGNPRSRDCRLAGPPRQVREARDKICAILEKAGKKVPPNVNGFRFFVVD